MGELSLDGSLNPIRGVLPIAAQRTRKDGFEGFLLPAENANEAGIVDKLKVFPIENLKQAVDFLNGKIDLPPANFDTRAIFEDQKELFAVDFADVRGQENVKER